MPGQPRQLGSGRISKQDFLRQQREFAWVKVHGKGHFGRLFVANCVAAPDQQTRLGLIVSKRFHRHAVQRNRARRLLRETFRLTRYAISEPTWLVVVARPPLRDAKVQDVQREFLRLLHRAGLADSDPTGS